MVLYLYNVSLSELTIIKEQPYKLYALKPLTQTHISKYVQFVEKYNQLVVAGICYVLQETLSDVMDRAPIGVHLAFVGYSYTATR